MTRSGGPFKRKDSSRVHDDDDTHLQVRCDVFLGTRSSFTPYRHPREGVGVEWWVDRGPLTTSLLSVPGPQTYPSSLSPRKGGREGGRDDSGGVVVSGPSRPRDPCLLFTAVTPVGPYPCPALCLISLLTTTPGSFRRFPLHPYTYVSPPFLLGPPGSSLPLRTVEGRTNPVSSGLLTVQSFGSDLYGDQ